MKVLIVGGCGFVGLNVAEAFATAGHDVTLLDRAPMPDAARTAFQPLPGNVRDIVGDVTNPAAVRHAVAGVDVVVLGAAITADAAREARDPASIIAVNLLGMVPILEAARDACCRRVINLSSAAAIGSAAFRAELIDEDVHVDPESLYAITKFASERVCSRLASLWSMDVVSVRLSGVFGPWERLGGLRDTPSPQAQILVAAAKNEPALLARAGSRDWVYSVDVAEAVLALAAAPHLPRRLYNISTANLSSALEFGQRLAAIGSDFACRITEQGEVANIALHSTADRAPLDAGRIFEDAGWRARFTLRQRSTTIRNGGRASAPPCFQTHIISRQEPKHEW